jgi:putative endonuclease
MTYILNINTTKWWFLNISFWENILNTKYLIQNTKFGRSSNGRTAAFEAVYPGSPQPYGGAPCRMTGRILLMYYIYILLLSNNQLYTGYTNDLKRRILEHKGGGCEFTKQRLPIKLIHYEAYLKKSDAERREKYLKTTEGKRFLKQQIRDLLESIKVIN